MQWCSLVAEYSAYGIQAVSSYPHAYGRPDSTAIIRRQPDDFQVDEMLGFQPEGEGEHMLLCLRKRNTNTDWLAQQLAKFVGVSVRDVGYAGLKDRNAVTSQWFSVRIPSGTEPDWSQLESDEVQLLDRVRHRRKLRRGALRQNRFCLRLRELKGDRSETEARLARIAIHGVPNYFGEQRFGHDQNNLGMADRLFAGRLGKISRHKRGIYLSAVRSYLFNMVLAKRVADGNWDQAVPGDLMLLDGTRSHFPVLEVDDEIQRRIAELDIHPSGPLCGKGEQPIAADAAELEMAVLQAYPEWTHGLARIGLSSERRALRIKIIDLEWDWLAKSDLELRFALRPGSYATTVLREIASVG
jgi:tRNA pseudouridine13 synthase